MPTLIIDKDGGYITKTENGVVNRTSIKLVDCVVSVPPSNFRKITNSYVEPNTGKLIIIHE